jgi:hypothetical protein
MAKQIINVGQTANDKKGDSLRAAFTKVNANFTELYSLEDVGQIIAGDALSKTGNQLDVVVSASGGIEIFADALQLKSTVAGNGLTYNSGVIDVGGTSGRISVSANAIDIDTSYVGQTSITTLGTITTGTWNGTAIGTVYGGTGLTSYAAGDIIYASSTNTLAKLAAGVEGKVLQINDSGIPVWGDIDGGTY